MAGGGSLESEGGGFEGECDSFGGETTAMRKKAAAFSIKAVLKVRTTAQSLYSEYTDRAIGFFFPCFWRQHSHEVVNQLAFIAIYSNVFAYIQTGSKQVHIQWHRHDFTGRADKPMGREYQTFFSEI